ncbi:MAG TPA: hypothetical protein P5255_15725, partial [Phycisphaerae bacterium]|nr:hypothetical protein [Phycisphaerae bacterium]
MLTFTGKNGLDPKHAHHAIGQWRTAEPRGLIIGQQEHTDQLIAVFTQPVPILNRKRRVVCLNGPQS